MCGMGHVIQSEPGTRQIFGESGPHDQRKRWPGCGFTLYVRCCSTATKVLKNSRTYLDHNIERVRYHLHKIALDIYIQFTRSPNAHYFLISAYLTIIQHESFIVCSIPCSFNLSVAMQPSLIEYLYFNSLNTLAWPPAAREDS